MEITSMIFYSLSNLFAFALGCVVGYAVTHPEDARRRVDDKLAAMTKKTPPRLNSGPIKPLTKRQREEMEDRELQRQLELTKKE